MLEEVRGVVLFVTEQVIGPTRTTGMNLQCTGVALGVEVPGVVMFAEVQVLDVTKKLSLPTPFAGG